MTTLALVPVPQPPATPDPFTVEAAAALCRIIPGITGDWMRAEPVPAVVAEAVAELAAAVDFLRSRSWTP